MIHTMYERRRAAAASFIDKINARRVDVVRSSLNTSSRTKCQQLIERRLSAQYSAPFHAAPPPRSAPLASSRAAAADFDNALHAQGRGGRLKAAKWPGNFTMQPKEAAAAMLVTGQASARHASPTRHAEADYEHALFTAAGRANGEERSAPSPLRAH